MNIVARRFTPAAGLPILLIVVLAIAGTFVSPLSTNSEAASRRMRQVHTTQSSQARARDDAPTLEIGLVRTIRSDNAVEEGRMTIVSLTSGGWQPGEVVRFQIYRSGASEPEMTYARVADADGNIKSTKLLLSNPEPGTREIIAKGRKSKKSRHGSFQIAVAETLTTLENTCTTPQAGFNLGDTVCARVTGVDGDEPTGAHFIWADPTGTVQQSGPDITTNNQTTTFTIPATGANAKCGAWTVQEVDASAVGFASATFNVSGPNCPSVTTFATDCTTPQAAFNLGDTVCAKVTVPDAGQLTNLRFDWIDPDGTNQEIGPTITMDGQTDTFVIPAMGANAKLGTWKARIAYASGGASTGSEASFTVAAAAGCTSITCPANVTQSNDPNQCGAVVNYPAPTPNGDCGTIMCSPGSGSFFPVGTTTVTCTSGAGPTCTFTVTVNDTQPPVITCPANQTAKTPTINDPCAVVNFTTTASDNCPGVVVVCNPPSGSCFPVGTTTVTCTATDASGNTATCSFTVTIFNVCLQDDSNPSIVFLANSITGAYRFCCGGMIFTGNAQVIRRGNTVSFQHYAPDRRVLATDDEGVFRGTASLQSPPGSIKCTITDRDTRNNTCVCQ